MHDAYDLLNGDVPTEDVGRVISQAADELDRIFLARPEAERGVLDIMDRVLGTPIDAGTWPRLESVLASYLGRNPAYFVAWATLLDPDARLAELQEHAPERVVSFLRSILGFYRGDLEKTYSAFTELPNDWRYLNREVLYDSVNGRHVVKIAVDQYSGERFVLEAKPYSFLELTRFMVETLGLLPDIFTREQVEQFAATVEKVTALLRVGAEGADQDSASHPNPMESSGAR